MLTQTFSEVVSTLNRYRHVIERIDDQIRVIWVYHCCNEVHSVQAEPGLEVTNKKGPATRCGIEARGGCYSVLMIRELSEKKWQRTGSTNLCLLC